MIVFSHAGENNCDLFSQKGRVISSFWLLKALDRSNARGGDYFANWTSKIFSEINQNNGIIFTECDLNNLSEIASNDGTLVILKNIFLYSVPISKASATLVHEGQHDHTSHIRCSRGLGNRRKMACDRGIYHFNPGESTYGSYTMDYIVFDELLGASFFETDNQDFPTIEKFDVLLQDGSTRPFCRNKSLLNLDQKNYVFSQLNFDWQEQINTPMDPYRYTTLWEMDFDYFPSWLCSPTANCEEYIFAEGNEGSLSCNETLNSDNVAINQHNLDVCNRGIDAYTSALNEPGSLNHEAANTIHQNELNRREREGRQCLPITQEHLDQYCDSRMGEATTAFNVDPFGYLEQYGQSNLDVCVQRYCEQPGIVTNLWNGLSGNEVYSTIIRLSNGNINSYIRENYSVGSSSCLEYFCGDDEKCKMRYIRYEGNLNIVNGDHSYCVEEYLTCIERSGETFALEGYSRESGEGNVAIDLYEVVFDTEFNLSENFGINDIENRVNTGLVGYSCMSAYNMCKIREVIFKGKILANLYREKAENEILISKALGLEKINPNDRISHRVRLSGKQHFTNELLFEIDRLKKSPQNLESVKRFNYWFSMPENQSKFAHYMPEDYLAFTNYKSASYIAVPWINSFKATDTSKLSSVANLIDEYNKLGKLLSNYKGEDIQKILLNASKNLPKKEYLELFNIFKSASTLTGKVDALERNEG